jgi:hypothetical protein
MRLVIRWDESDGCTYHCENIVPIVYESQEAFICDFEKALIASAVLKDFEFNFAGYTWSTCQFYLNYVNNKHLVSLPDILTLDEWYEGLE